MALLIVSLVIIVGCKKDDSTSSNSNYNTAPSVPTGLSAIVDGSRIKVSWNSVSGANNYRVAWSQNGSDFEYTFGLTSNTYFYDNSPYENNYYKVKAINDYGESDYSSHVYCHYSTGGGGGGTTVPNAPTNVSSSVNGSSVQITWSSVSNASSYKIYWSSSSYGTFSSIGTSYSPSYDDNSPMTDNYYKVTALNSNGESEKSNYTYCHYTSGGGITIPTAPTGLSAYNEGNAALPSIKISWNAVSNATSYKIYRSSSAYGSYSLIATNTAALTYDYNPLNGNNYYKVKAVNSAGESPYSDYALYNHNANAYAPCPVHYTSHTATSNTITLRWSNPTTSGCGVPTSAELRVRNPDSGTYMTLDTYSGSTTTASFNYLLYANSEGYVYCGIITKNSYGSSGGVALVYNYLTNTWYGGNGFDGLDIDE